MIIHIIKNSYTNEVIISEIIWPVLILKQFWVVLYI